MNSRETQRKSLQYRIQRLDTRLTDLSLLSRRYSWGRLAVFVGGALVSIALFHWAGVNAGVISAAITLLLFALVVRMHRRVNTTITQFTIWRRIKQTQLARLELDWKQIPVPLARPPEAAHPFARDLDLIGDRSLHHLINTAVSSDGSKRLGEWLTDSDPQPGSILKRQARVRELMPLARFRDKLILYSTLTTDPFGKQWDSRQLTGWLEQEAPQVSLRPTLLILSILSLLNIVLFLLNSREIIAPWWVITFVPYAALWVSELPRTLGLFSQTLAIGELLRTLETVFGYLETYPYARYPHLRELCKPFLDAEQRPSLVLWRMTRVISAASLQQTQLLWLFVNAVIPWDIFVAHRLDRLKAELRVVLPAWLDVWFELESLNALANLAYLNPEFCFPEFTAKTGGQPVLQGQALGHLLLAPETRVTNVFAIHALGEVVIVTGSNMSGKSSFLRTVGINLCLANAGGPVNATRFQTALFRLFTCINVSDSIADGISYFYAEVRRLKALLTALESDDKRPLLFLIDEIFRGTNNRERLIGSRAYVRALAGKNGVGIVSTHDLELVQLAAAIPQISNYHFEETVIDGQMIFDYRLRPGPSPTTNALKIMQLAGLPIDPQPD